MGEGHRPGERGFGRTHLPVRRLCHSSCVHGGGGGGGGVVWGGGGGGEEREKEGATLFLPAPPSREALHTPLLREASTSTPMPTILLTFTTPTL